MSINTFSHKTSILDKSSKKNELQKNLFLFSNSTLDELFIDTTHISLQCIYIDRPKLSEQKLFEFIVSSPQLGSEQKGV